MVTEAPYDPLVPRTSMLPLVLVLLVAGACSSTDSNEVAGNNAASPRLVLWNDTEIAVLEDGEITEIAATGAVSQVTASPSGVLVWTALETDPPSVKATIDGDERSTVDTPTVPFFYEWSPSGSRIAFLGNSTSGAGLVFGMIDVETREVTPIESPAPFFFDWSPDGERLIAHIGGASLGIIDAASGEVEDLGQESGPFPAPIWTEAGIVVVTQLGPTVERGLRTVSFQQARSVVVLIDPDTLSYTELTSVVGPVRLFPSVDGLAVVAGPSGSQTIEVLDWNGRSLETLEGDTIDLAQWSPDGATLLWTERDGDRSLTPMTWSGGEATRYDTFVPTSLFATAYLPFWDQYDRAISLWAPDSASFALPTQTVAGPEVVVRDLTGATASYPGWDMALWQPSGD